MLTIWGKYQEGEFPLSWKRERPGIKAALCDIYIGELKFSRKIYSVGLGLSLPRIFAHIFSLTAFLSLLSFLASFIKLSFRRGFAQSLFFHLGRSWHRSPFEILHSCQLRSDQAANHISSLIQQVEDSEVTKVFNITWALSSPLAFSAGQFSFLLRWDSISWSRFWEELGPGKSGFPGVVSRREGEHSHLTWGELPGQVWCRQREPGIRLQDPTPP